MLETRYKSPWRKVALNNAPTVGELYAAAGGSPVTVGFALGSGALPSGCSIGGVISFCAVPWGASAVAAARITRSGGRLMAQVAKSATGTLRVLLPGEATITVSLANARAAIPLLDVANLFTYGNTVPWWPAGEAYAQAGIWMRRRSWSDPSRRMRFEAGAGTTAAVAVAISSIDTIHDAQGNTDFTADEFLGDDWEAYAIGEPPAVDVTDFRIDALSSRAEGFFFAVDELPVVVPPVVPPVPPVVPPDGVVVAPPASGDYVWMGRNGVGQWVLVREFACAD